MADTYGLCKKIWDKLNKCVDIDREADSLLEYLLNVAPNTYVLVDEYLVAIEPDPENVYLTYGSIEGAEEARYDELGWWNCVKIITELQFLCAHNFDATRFFRDNANI